MSIRGLMILYHRYIACIKNREFDQLHVWQNGCVNRALGVKYLSIASRCIEGGDWVSVCITLGISLTIRWCEYRWRDGRGYETDLGPPFRNNKIGNRGRVIVALRGLNSRVS